MDHAHRDRFRAALLALPGRVRELPGRIAPRLLLARPKESVARKLKITALVATAIVFGTLAHRINVQETQIQWRKSHLPSSQIWRASMQTLGFRSIDNPGLLGRLSRRLPSLTDPQGKVWSAAPDWWAVESGEGGPPLIFCLGCDAKAVPSGWQSAGTGWEGWENAMKTAREQAASPLARSKSPRPHIETDPRAIRY